MEVLENIQNYNPSTQEGDLGRDARLKLNNNFKKITEAVKKLETNSDDLQAEVYANHIDGGNA